MARVRAVPGLPTRSAQADLHNQRNRIVERAFPSNNSTHGAISPDEQSALKVLYLPVLSREKNKTNPTGQITGWKNILNVLSMTYGDRLGIN